MTHFVWNFAIRLVKQHNKSLSHSNTTLSENTTSAAKCSPHSADCQLKVCVFVCLLWRRNVVCNTLMDVCAGRGQVAMSYGGETCYCRDRVVLIWSLRDTSVLSLFLFFMFQNEIKNVHSNEDKEKCCFSQTCWAPCTDGNLLVTSLVSLYSFRAVRISTPALEDGGL